MSNTNLDPYDAENQYSAEIDYSPNSPAGNPDLARQFVQEETRQELSKYTVVRRGFFERIKDKLGLE